MSFSSTNIWTSLNQETFTGKAKVWTHAFRRRDSKGKHVFIPDWQICTRFNYKLRFRSWGLEMHRCLSGLAVRRCFYSRIYRLCFRSDVQSWVSAHQWDMLLNKTILSEELCSVGIVSRAQWSECNVFWRFSVDEELLENASVDGERFIKNPDWCGSSLGSQIMNLRLSDLRP